MARVKRGWLRAFDAQGPTPKVSRKGGVEPPFTHFDRGDTNRPIGKAQPVKQGRFRFVDDPMPHNVEGFAAPAKKGHHPLPSGPG